MKRTLLCLVPLVLVSLLLVRGLSHRGPAEEPLLPPAQLQTFPLKEAGTTPQELVDSFYALRQHYLQQLDQLVLDAYQAYQDLSQDQLDQGALAKLLSQTLDRAAGLEKLCDSQVEELARRLRQSLRDYGGDLSLPDTILQTYAQEKSFLKSAYLELLEKKGNYHETSSVPPSVGPDSQPLSPAACRSSGPGSQ